MPVVQPRHVLSGMLVKEAMRRQVVRLPAAAPLAAGIRHLLKHKVNALLATDDRQRPAGVVSKTDLLAAFYAGLPTDTPLEGVMVGPARTCFPDEALEAALERMGREGVHRLYVAGAEAGLVEGTLAYTDVVALLYRYCRACPRSTARRGTGAAEGSGERLRVREVMTAGVVAYPETAPLTEVIEGLLAHRFGAVLVTGEGGAARGVISKTDLVRAYLHGRDPATPAAAVMSAPVVTWGQEAPLWEALQQMFLMDVQRLFVHAGDPERIVGVLSLSDAARVRSGTCRACLPSRYVAPA